MDIWIRLPSASQYAARSKLINDNLIENYRLVAYSADIAKIHINIENAINYA